jgi:hypothetical protein
MPPSENLPFLAGSDRSDALPPDIRKVLAEFKEDSNRWNRHVAERTTKKAGTIALSSVISHFTGLGSLIDVPGIVSTKTHLERLKKLQEWELECSDKTICAGVLGYAMTQKEKN